MCEASRRQASGGEAAAAALEIVRAPGVALGVESRGAGERAVAADANEGVDLQGGEGALGLGDDGGRDVAAVAAVADFGDEMTLAGRAEDGAAEVHDAGGAGDGQRHAGAALGEESLEAVVKTDDFPAEIRGRADDAAEDGVQAGAIAAAGKDSDAFHEGVR